MKILSWIFKKKKDNDVLAYYPDAVLTVSVSGEILYANERLLELLQMTSDELFNTELLDLFDGGFNLIHTLAKSNDSAVVRSKLKIKNENSENNRDEDLFFEIKASEYEDDEIIITLRDVTNSQKMLNKLLFEHEYTNKLNRNKSNFLSKISGELTSPVHSINGFSQAILEGLGGDVNEKQEKYLKIINKNSTQLLDLLNNLIEYTKLESGICEYEFKNFDFVSQLISIFNEYKPKADEKKLILNIDLNSLAKRTVYSDESLLKRIIEILIQNAIDTTDSGSIQVVVSHPDNEYLEISGFNVSPAQPEKSHILVSITDTSAGVSENELANIFAPYVNIEKYISKKQTAKSLEMGIAYNLVKTLKGKMWAESEPTKGSRYSFIIPIERVSI